MVESTLIVWEDLSSSPMYAKYVLFNCYCFNIIIEHVDWWHNDWIVLVSMKYELVWYWFGIAWLWVQVLENSN